MVFFDADGVLIKKKHLFSEQLEQDFGIKTATTLPFFKGIFTQCTLGKADLKKELARVIPQWGWNGTVEELMEYWFTKGTVIDQDVVEYIQSLTEKGFRCFMATGQEKYRGEHLQRTLGNGQIFERVFYTADIGYPKEDSRFWERVFSIVGEKPQQILFIDDSEKTVKAVAESGIETYLFTDLTSLKKRLAEYV